MEAKPEAPKESPTLPAGALQVAEFRRTVFAVDVPRPLPVEALLEPTYWAHFAAQFKPWDKLEARAVDGTWYAELIVLDCSRTWARVAIVVHKNLSTSDVSQTAASEAEAKSVIDAHEVRHNQTRKWHIVNRSNKSVLAEGFVARDDAETFLRQHALHLVGRAPAPQVPQTA